jgi:hypothetical protein
MWCKQELFNLFNLFNNNLLYMEHHRNLGRFS